MIALASTISLVWTDWLVKNVKQPRDKTGHFLFGEHNIKNTSTLFDNILKFLIHELFWFVPFLDSFEGNGFPSLMSVNASYERQCKLFADYDVANSDNLIPREFVVPI